MRTLLFAALLLSVPARTDDAEEVKASCLDYIEGWYTGDVVRVERALHPEMVVRFVNTVRRRRRLEGISAMTLLEAVRMGGGKNTPAGEQQKDVTVLDVYQNAASAKVVSGRTIDYLHLVRWDGRWKIVSILREWKLAPH